MQLPGETLLHPASFFRPPRLFCAAKLKNLRTFQKDSGLITALLFSHRLVMCHQDIAVIETRPVYSLGAFHPKKVLPASNFLPQKKSNMDT